MKFGLITKVVENVLIKLEPAQRTLVCNRFVATAHYWLYIAQPEMCTTSNVYNVQHHIRLCMTARELYIIRLKCCVPCVLAQLAKN